MTDDDLAEALGKLEDTRVTVDTRLRGVQNRKAALDDLERDRDMLLESYAGMMPEALDALAADERRQVYGMLRLKVEIAADGSMEVRGVLSETLQVLHENGRVLCVAGVTPRCKSRFTKLSELRFHAALGIGIREVRFEWGSR